MICARALAYMYAHKVSKVIENLFKQISSRFGNNFILIYLILLKYWYYKAFFTAIKHGNEVEARKK